MKKSILALTLVSVLGVSSVFAADPAAIQQRVDQLKTEFNLDPAQAQNIANTLAGNTAAPVAANVDTQAQRDAKMAEHIDNRISRMKTDLNLTDDQATQLKAILTEQHAKRETLRTETETRITSVLTPEQATKLKSLRDSRGGFGMESGPDGKGRHGGGHHRGGHGGDWGDKSAE